MTHLAPSGMIAADMVEKMMMIHRCSSTIAVSLALLLGPSTALAVQPHVEAGFGLPELIHARAGLFVHPRVSTELYGSNTVLNWLVGAGASGYWLGQPQGELPPRHALLTRLTAAVNPAAPLQLQSGGDRIGSALLVEAGYALTLKSGFAFRARAGAILLVEGSLTGGPNASVSAGWIF